MTDELIKFGHTDHFEFLFQSSLGDLGKQVCQEFIEASEALYSTLRSWFTSALTNQIELPYHVVVGDGSDGASHKHCADTVIQIGAKSVANAAQFPDFMNFLLFSEVSEVLMWAQDDYWDCQANNGEALSRVLAADLCMPGKVVPKGFLTGPAWYKDQQNYIDKTIGTDKNSVATGCGVLFLNWLCFRLNFSWPAIIAAGAPNLAEVYTNLTKRSDAWSTFLAMIASDFPATNPIVTDNPFVATSLRALDARRPPRSLKDDHGSRDFGRSLESALRTALGELVTTCNRMRASKERPYVFPNGIGEIELDLSVGSATEAACAHLKIVGIKGVLP